MPKKRNSNKNNSQSIKGIGCSHMHTHTLTKLKINVCFNCLMIYYSNCEYHKIEDSKEAIQSIKILQTYLDDIKVTAQVNRFHNQFKTFFDDLNVFFADLDPLNKRLKTAIQQNKYEEFSIVKDEAIELMQRLEDSQVMSIYARHRAHSLLEIRINGISGEESMSNSKKTKLNDMESNSKLEETSTSKEESKETPKDDYIMLMENYAEKYRDLELKVLQQNEEKENLEIKVRSLNEVNKENKDKCIAFETQIENLKETHIEDEKRIEKLEEGMKTWTKIMIFMC